MFSSLADHATKPQALLTKEQEREHLQLLISRMTVHLADHNAKFFGGCQFCAARATDAIECHTCREDEAHQFLALQDSGYIMESIRAVRNALGRDAPTWMFKEEYLR